jgi:hypothetical protein
MPQEGRMTVQPNAPEAPAPEAPKPAEPTAVAPEATKPAEPAPAKNVWEDPETAKAEIERLRKENAKDRTTARQTAADEAKAALAQEIGKALGLVKDEPVDPAKLTEQITAAQADAKRAQVALAVYQNAATAGADPLALLDSATFLAKAAALDPTDVDGLKAAMTEAVTANPRLGAAPESRTPAPNPAQGSSGGGTQNVAQLSEADVKRMYAEKDYDGISKAQAEGRLSSLLGT